MVMQDLVDAGTFDAEGVAIADEFLPGWREWEPVDFAARATPVIAALLEGAAAKLRKIHGA